MDSGLGSDEDRRGGRTKEQKQLRNQQLLSNCFIDAASLSDEGESSSSAAGLSTLDRQRRDDDERRRGALIFKGSLMRPSAISTTTPFNSIVDLDGAGCHGTSVNNNNNNCPATEQSSSGTRRSPLGFYVDLGAVEAEAPQAPPRKNIFSMVIDFGGPKKDKPVKLSSSALLLPHLRRASRRSNGTSSLSSSVSSIASGGPAGHPDDDGSDTEGEVTVFGPVLNGGAKKSSGWVSETITTTTMVTVTNNAELEEFVESPRPECEDELVELVPSDKCGQGLGDCEGGGGGRNCDSPLHSSSSNSSTTVKKSPVQGHEDECPEPENGDKSQGSSQDTPPPQFVRLADLDCHRPPPPIDHNLDFTPRMSKSIPPESSWVESPLLMSRSAGYRSSAPRPLEPESDEAPSPPLSHSHSHHRHHHKQQPRRLAQRLGTDLLRMFLEEISPDVTVEVDGHRLKAHKCILASRCQYFAAMLSGDWLEQASGNVISLQGFSYESVYFALCHIYSGAAHVPDSISLVELASLADMLSLEGLKEVVEHALKQRHCHNFHRPCAGCCSGVLEVLPLSAAYGLDDLYRRCLQWITEHFVRVWPSRGFAALARELREKCYQQHVVHLSPERVLDVTGDCDRVMAALPRAGWAEAVAQLTSQLADACHLYLRQHFAAVLGSASFRRHGLTGGKKVEDLMMTAASGLGVEQACRSYARCCKLLDEMSECGLLIDIRVQVEQCLVSQSDRLIRSNAWLRLDSALRCRIKDLTPGVESSSRLPRATPKQPPQSSSDSSRNSSPGVLIASHSRNNSGGSPSLRRSLLLAARAPQVPATSSSTSSLTRPTQSSAAKSTPSKNIKPQPVAVARPAAVKKPAPVVRGTITSTLRKNQTQTQALSSGNQNNKSRSGSPLKGASSPRKGDVRASSPRKNLAPSATAKSTTNSVSCVSSGSSKNDKRAKQKAKSSTNVVAPVVGVMQRSSTFSKDQPTVMGKMIFEGQQ